MASLARLHLTVFDSNGVPVSGASVEVRKQGATIQSGGPTSFTVDDSADITAADEVALNAGSTSIGVDSTTATNVTVAGPGLTGSANNDRLTVTNNLPILYLDVVGNAATSNPLTSDSTGEVAAWVESGYYDILISGTGVTTELRQDAVPGWAFPITAEGNGQVVTIDFDADINPQSGAQGLRLMRDAAVRPIVLSWGTGTTVEWEAGLDATSDDLVLAYDPEAPGDVFRGRKGSHWNLGRVVGQPTVNYRLALLSDASDTNPVDILKFETVAGSSATSYIRAALDGTDNFQVATSGAMAAGKVLGGYIAGGSEFETALTVHKEDATPSIRLRLDGVSTVQYQMIIDTGASNNFAIEEVSTGFNVFSITNAAIANSLLIRANGSISVKATAAEVHSGAGTPEGAVTAPIGSLYMRTDGGAGTTLYVKEANVDNTGWAGV